MINWFVYILIKRRLLKKRGYTKEKFKRGDGSFYVFWKGVGYDWRGDEYNQEISHDEVRVTPVSYLKQRIGSRHIHTL